MLVEAKFIVQCPRYLKLSTISTISLQIRMECCSDGVPIICGLNSLRNTHLYTYVNACVSAHMCVCLYVCMFERRCASLYVCVVLPGK